MLDNIERPIANF